MNFEIPLSLYIHIPWCVQKCPYCDFNSYALDKNAQPEKIYVQALTEDLQADAHLAQGRKLKSIFIGGGTPSLFSPGSIELILNAARKLFIFDPDIEITLEANPGTFEYQKFADFVSAGVNRISLGVQSFDDDQLKTLGRIHQSAEARRAIESLHRIPLRSFNIDLMYALPNQTVDQALTDLRTALSYQPKHFSWYHLTLEPNTVFYRNPPKNMPDEDRVILIETAGRDLLAENHLHRYEVSAYAADNHQSVHNKNYWNFGDYLGIGAGAHGKITDLNTGIITRTTKQKIPKNYLNPDLIFTSSQRVLLADELPLEFMMNTLRLTEGFNLDLFTQRTGLPEDILKPMIKMAIQKELLTMTNNTLKPTALGAQFLNDLVGIF